MIGMCTSGWFPDTSSVNFRGIEHVKNECLDGLSECNQKEIFLSLQET